jgi:periplasmic divalent cation tolerance protein
MPLHRLRAMRDRAIDHGLERLLPSGAFGSDVDDPVAYHRAPLALAATGHTAAALRVLDHTLRRYVRPDGDVRIDASTRSHDAECAATAARMPAMLALGAARTGRTHAALPLLGWLNGLRASANDTSLMRGALAHGPAHGAGHDGVTDLAATLGVAAVDLALGHAHEALLAARWIAALWSAQPHADAFLLRRDGTGALVTLWPAGDAACMSVSARGPGHGHGLLGDVLAWLTDCTALAVGDERAQFEAARDGVLRFALRCAPHARRADEVALLARGFAVCARAMRRDVVREALAHESSDAALTLGLRAVGQWHASGGFGVPGDEESPASRIDRNFAVAWALHEVLTALDTTEPRREARSNNDGWRVVLCNVPEIKAHEVADAVVAERLAACVNAVPAVSSTYEWKGKVERDREVTLWIKTTSDRVAALTARLRALHPYDLPEVIALAVVAEEGYAPYLDWVRAQTRTRTET